MGKALDLKALQSSATPLTVVIYWPPREGPDALQNGHAALIIDSVQFNPVSADWYVSWIGEGSSPFKAKAKASTFYVDAQEWGGFAVGNKGFRVPTRWVALQGLNITAMKTAWDQMCSKQDAHWKLLDKNCATAVARILKAGDADRLATAAKKQLIWWPTDLIRYARSMGAAIVDQS
jgi:hypothetical protein